MPEGPDAFEILGRAGKRAAFHLIQALIEGLKAVEAVIEEVGTISDRDHHDDVEASVRTKIDIE